MQTLIIGVSITGTVVLVVMLTALFICCSSKLLKERAIKAGKGMEKKKYVVCVCVCVCVRVRVCCTH
jgi:hypothetical protein